MKSINQLDNILLKRQNHYIKDPIHKEINFSSDKWLMEFVYSYEMIRLLEIKQLGISYKIFPSATNNRFTHCLGTFHLAKKFAKHFINSITKNERKLFLIAALLHDIGHGPYSHVFEKIANINHENIGHKIILDPNLAILNLLKKNKINPNTLIDIYLGRSNFPWISRLISSNLDVDRIDYLLRDSYYVGTYFATIDTGFLIERALIINNDVCFNKSATNYIESFLLGRYYMHQDIYDNKHNLTFEWILLKIFERLKEIKDTFKLYSKYIYFYDLYEWIIFEKEVDISKTYIYLNDGNFNSFIWSLKILNDEILNSFVDGFFNFETIIVVNYSDVFFNKLISVAKNINIDSKYLYQVKNKTKKLIYQEGAKNEIKLYDPNKNELFKFSSKGINILNKNLNSKNYKIIVMNKTLLNYYKK